MLRFRRVQKDKITSHPTTSSSSEGKGRIYHKSRQAERSRIAPRNPTHYGESENPFHPSDDTVSSAAKRYYHIRENRQRHGLSYPMACHPRFDKWAQVGK